MDRADIASGASAQTVTASELVRQFGLWQERAAHAPVYVLHRGRPRLVLTSVSVMEALCTTPVGDDARDRHRLATLLGLGHDLILWCDRDGAVTPASRAALALFGAGPITLGDIAATGGAFLATAVERALSAGIGEMIEFAPARFPKRCWTARIEPMAEGAVLILQDIDGEAERRRLAAEAEANEAAMLALGDVTAVRIGLRGFIESPPLALSRLSRLAIPSLAGARFVSLFDVPARVAIGEAIDAALVRGEARAIEARLLVNRRSPRMVRIAMAPITGGPRIEGARALIVATERETP